MFPDEKYMIDVPYIIPYIQYIIFKKPFEGMRVKQHQYHILETIDKYISKSLISSSATYVK